jgi:hypothetical protein
LRSDVNGTSVSSAVPTNDTVATVEVAFSTATLYQLLYEQ